MAAGRNVDELAGLQYRVERIESALLTRMIQFAWQTAAPMRGRPLLVLPAPDRNRPLVMQEATAGEIAANSGCDLLRIIDREGNVVWFREYRRREEGVRKEKEIMDDLLLMDAARFRSKHAITPERPTAVDARGDAWAPPPQSDPWAGLPRPKRDLLDD